jgi:hypothetical protein
MLLIVNFYVFSEPNWILSSDPCRYQSNTSFNAREILGLFRIHQKSQPPINQCNSSVNIHIYWLSLTMLG